VKAFILLTILSLVLGFSAVSLADGEPENSAKPFFSSCLYGTLAGGLIGTATLAFTSNPGDNLSNIARGASLGLYGGIILGIYLTYGVNDSSDAAPAPPSTENSKKKENKVSISPVIDPSMLGGQFTLNF
jgi:hypothetical protein